MISEIIKGVTRTLHANFENVTIYTEKVTQGLKVPCFFVMTLNPSETPLLGVRAHRTNPISVTYIPQSKTSPRAEMEGVASKLHVILRQIKLVNGDYVNGFGLRYEMTGESLTFLVNYNHTVRYVSDEKIETQGSLNHTIHVEGANNER